MAAKTTDFFGSDARLKIKGISGVNLSVKLSNELAKLFGISVMDINDGGFNAPIIKALSPGIPWTTNKKIINLAYFVIIECGTIGYEICLYHFVLKQSSIIGVHCNLYFASKRHVVLL